MVSMTNEEIDYAKEYGPFTEDGWIEISPGMYTPGRPAINAFLKYYDSPEGIAERQEISEILNFREDTLKYVDINGFMYEEDIAEGEWDDKLKICRDSFSRLIELLQNTNETISCDYFKIIPFVCTNKYVIVLGETQSIYTEKAYQEWFLPSLQTFERIIKLPSNI